MVLELVHRWTCRTALGGVVLLATAWHPALAGPLEAEQCTKLSATITTLDQAGIKTILEKGPAASKGTLTKEQRDQIRTYLDTLAALRFRCPNEPPFVTLKPEPPEDPAEATALTAPIEANTPGITLPPGVAAAIVAPIVPKKPPVPKQAKAPAAAPAAKPGDPQVAPAVPAKPKPQPAAKAAAPAPAPAPPQAPAAAPAPPKPKPKAKADDAFKPEPAKPEPARETAQPKAP